MLDIAIVLNGEIKDQQGFEYLLNQATYIIAADGGLNHLIDLEIKPNLFLGDFDSVKQTSLEKATEWQLKIDQYPERKNFTDSELAINHIFSENLLRKYNGKKPTIGFLAAFGSRYDHLLSNQLLAAKNADKANFILTDGLALQWIINGPKEMNLNWPLAEHEATQQFNFSLLALSPLVEKITLQNSEYLLKEYDLKRGSSIGVSNLVKQNRMSSQQTAKIGISFSKGCLSIIILPAL